MNKHNEEEVQKKGSAKKRLFILLLLVLVAGLGVFGYWWTVLRWEVSTEDAYVHADSAMISPRISGTIQSLPVDNDDWVDKGQTLVTLDPEVYQSKVDEIQAGLERLRAERASVRISRDMTDVKSKAQVRQAEAGLQAARETIGRIEQTIHQLEFEEQAVRAEHTQAERDYQRYTKLLKRGAISQDTMDRAQTTLDKVSAQLKAVQADIQSKKAELTVARQEVVSNEAKVKQAKAGLDEVKRLTKQLQSVKAQIKEMQAKLNQAELNLKYCTIQAPISGYVAQKQVQVGHSVQPGQALFAVVPLQDVYVEANFKETDLERVCVGQPVHITADMYPDQEFMGHVAGIRAGTGSAFSLLPPENASGNWIKVVQRVPVRIELDQPQDPDYPLRIGLSLHVRIDVSSMDGPRLLQPEKGLRARKQAAETR